MQFSLPQIFLSTFLLFAVLKVLARYREGVMPVSSFLFWFSVFLLGLTIILVPSVATKIAKTVGIGRGVDVIIYVSIILIFYLIFRLYMYLEDIRHDLTELVKRLALKNQNPKNDRRHSKD